MFRRNELVCLVSILSMTSVWTASFAQEKIYSGPQVGEELPPFTVRGVYDESAGKEMDFVSDANGKPIVLIFVHDLNRQAIGFTRILTQYTRDRAKHGLATGVVWLDNDVTEGENTLKRIRHALTDSVPIGISVDGREGPGAYGLNRKVTITVLVGKENRITGNFALVQPSLQTDLTPIVEHISKLLGTPAPKLEELTGPTERMQSSNEKPAVPNLRPYLAPIIRLDASNEQVDEAAAKLIALADKDEAVRKELGRITSTIVNAQKLENYGTPRAREFIAKWAKQYGPESSPPAPK
jgi:hypothetical protein